MVSAVRERKELSSLGERELCYESHAMAGAVAGQSSMEQAWKGVWRSELETGGSADSGSQTHLELRGLGQITKWGQHVQMSTSLQCHPGKNKIAITRPPIDTHTYTHPSAIESCLQSPNSFKH